MKIFQVFLLILLFGSTTASAGLIDTFYQNYEQKGVDHAVKTALAKGYSLDRIIKTALTIKELEREELIKALFCSLALPGSIYDAAAANGISEDKVTLGYERALAECGPAMEENLNAAVSPNNQPPGHSSSEGTNKSSSASPWNFE